MGIRSALRRGVNSLLGWFGWELRRKAPPAPDPRAWAFPYFAGEAARLGMDVNDYEEQVQGWPRPEPILEALVFPRLRPDSAVCEIGPGTGRWSRHLLARLPEGELHLVDHSPWIVDFLRGYFGAAGSRVRLHLADGASLPFGPEPGLDLVCCFGGFVSMKLGTIYAYSRSISACLAPGGWCVLDYVDVGRPEAWAWLEANANAEYADIYTYHDRATVNRVLSLAGLEVAEELPSGYSTYVVLRKPR